LNALNKPANRTGQRGYALTEVLIATAIAAGVLTAIAGALSGVVRLNARSEERAQQLTDIKIIAARLNAGMSGDDIFNGLTGWKIEQAPLSLGGNGEASSTFDIVIIKNDVNEARSFEFLARRIAGQR
jgi:prepilin-type N-terminal cleavage/methylation domain-containing protein